MDDEGHLVLQREAISDTRERQLRSRTVREFLVRWKNLPNVDATWESEKILQHPSLQLL
ncbi:chromo domain-containing protein [Acinetobacter baumannii]